jgi:hypothetical protein
MNLKSYNCRVIISLIIILKMKKRLCNKFGVRATACVPSLHPLGSSWYRPVILSLSIMTVQVANIINEYRAQDQGKRWLAVRNIRICVTLNGDGLTPRRWIEVNRGENAKHNITAKFYTSRNSLSKISGKSERNMKYCIRKCSIFWYVTPYNQMDVCNQKFRTHMSRLLQGEKQTKQEVCMKQNRRKF